MKDLRELNRFRDREGEKRIMISDNYLRSKAGLFKILLKTGSTAIVICENYGDWEHVSVTIFEEERCPFWNEMCEIKDLFFNENEVVMQIHPKKIDYVNFHEFCLHMWRPNKEQIPLPPKQFV
jgi:hypothetical protein